MALTSDIKLEKEIDTRSIPDMANLVLALYLFRSIESRLIPSKAQEIQEDFVEPQNEISF